jgi:hypothetical protein
MDAEQIDNPMPARQTLDSLFHLKMDCRESWHKASKRERDAEIAKLHPEHSIREIAAATGLSRNTVWRATQL